MSPSDPCVRCAQVAQAGTTTRYMALGTPFTCWAWDSKCAVDA